jgi:hypothetical protein
VLGYCRAVSSHRRPRNVWRETFIDEMYAHIQTAMGRANRLRIDLVKAGWTVMSD